MDCPGCGGDMSVSDSRPLKSNPLVVHRRRTCSQCRISFQTEEHPRLWIKRDGQRMPFHSPTLMVSLQRAARDCGVSISDRDLHLVLRTVIAGTLSDAALEQSSTELRRRVGETLLAEGLEEIAYRYDSSLDPEAFSVTKRGARGSEPFDRDKLTDSIAAAAAKFLDLTAVSEIVAGIEAELGASSGPLGTDEIRLRVGDALRRRELRAYLRYALAGAGDDESLNAILARIAPTAQVRKRDGSVVLFDGAKLGKSLRLSFPDGLRDAQDPAIAEFVASQERHVRELMATERATERTSNIGERALSWLFQRDERAWANYWLAFKSDHHSAASPIRQLFEARARLQGDAEK